MTKGLGRCRESVVIAGFYEGRLSMSRYAEESENENGAVWHVGTHDESILVEHDAGRLERSHTAASGSLLLGQMAQRSCSFALSKNQELWRATSAWRNSWTKRSLAKR
jgi:hypothetical protein